MLREEVLTVWTNLQERIIQITKDFNENNQRITKIRSLETQIESNAQLILSKSEQQSKLKTNLPIEWDFGFRRMSSFYLKEEEEEEDSDSEWEKEQKKYDQIYKQISNLQENINDLNNSQELLIKESAKLTSLCIEKI